MRKLILLPLYLVLVQATPTFASNKTLYLFPEFRFDYASNQYDVDAYKESNDLTGKSSQNEIYVRSKREKGFNMHIETSYASDHAWSNSTKNVYDSYYSIYYDSPFSYNQPVDYELSKEYVTLNGLTFTVKRFLNEACGREGKSNSYYYTMTLDTVFREFSRLKVKYTTHQVAEEKLPPMRSYITQLIQFFSGFSIVPSLQVLSTADQFTADQLQLKYDSQVHYFQKRFSNQIKKAFRNDTSGVSISLACAYYFSPEQIKAFRKQDNLQLITDTLIYLRKRRADSQLNLYLDMHKRYNYSQTRQSDFLRKLANHEFPYDYYLNTAWDPSPLAENGLDTLYKMLLIATTAPEDVFLHWRYDGSGYRFSRYSQTLWDTTNAFMNLYGLRTYSQFVPDLMRKLYAETLKSKDANFHPYLQLIDKSETKSFLVFNPEQYHRSELMLATFRKSSDTWKLEIDTLDPSMRLRGKERLREYGDYFIFEQQDSIYLLDSRTSPVTMTSLPFTGDSLDHYTFYSKEVAFNNSGGFIAPQRCQFQRDKVDPASIELIWNQLVRDRKIIVNSEYNPCYTCIDLNHGDSLIPPLSYYNYVRMSVPTDQSCYRSGYTIRDLDGDGKEEMYCYTVSNGELKDWTCYWLKEGRITYMEPTQAKALIEQDGDCLNLKAFSKIGRKTKQPVTSR